MNQPRKFGVEVGAILAGKYRVEEILGAGGMGIVVAATHIDLQDVRAIKLMRPAKLDNQQAIERFLREARAAVKLRSEHVAEVYDVGRLDSGAPYIVMELLSGHDLSIYTRAHKQLPFDRAALYVFQACHALAEAHAAGIIHRDVKPANLFLTTRPDGSPCIKVLDFGISKQAGRTGAADMTGIADVMGSPMYMSPEQMLSTRDVDARTDIWALGLILYRLLAGRAPFQAQTWVEMFVKMREGKRPLPPSAWRPELPKELDAAVMHCLEREVSARMPTVNQLMQALKPFATNPAPCAPADKPGADMRAVVAQQPSNPVQLSVPVSAPRKLRMKDCHYFLNAPTGLEIMPLTAQPQSTQAPVPAQPKVQTAFGAGNPYPRSPRNRDVLAVAGGIAGMTMLLIIVISMVVLKRLQAGERTHPAGHSLAFDVAHASPAVSIEPPRVLQPESTGEPVHAPQAAIRNPPIDPTHSR